MSPERTHLSLPLFSKKERLQWRPLEKKIAELTGARGTCLFETCPGFCCCCSCFFNPIQFILKLKLVSPQEVLIYRKRIFFLYLSLF